jgi:hypothetical protein
MNRVEKGCFIEKDTDYQKYRPFMKMLGCGKVYRVPLRTRGLTSSGIPSKCHSNVALAVKAFGGRQIFGYLLSSTQGEQSDSMVRRASSILEPRTKALMFLHHSVWETPEGKWVDITNGRGRQIFGACDSFTPVDVANPKIETIFGTTNFVVHGNYRKKGIWITTTDYALEDKIYVSLDRMKDVARKLSWFRVSVDSSDEKRFIKSGGFTEPSIFTNKTFSEIQTERLAA